MAIPNLVRTKDDKLGTIYKAPSSPVTFTSAGGATQLFAVDGSTLPDSSMLNPWKVKFQIKDYQLNNPYGASREFIEANHIMEMYPQYSTDSTNWNTYDNWNLTPHIGMTGIVESKIEMTPTPRYMRVMGRLYPDANGDTTASILMGFSNFTL